MHRSIVLRSVHTVLFGRCGRLTDVRERHEKRHPTYSTQHINTNYTRFFALERNISVRWFVRCVSAHPSSPRCRSSSRWASVWHRLAPIAFIHNSTLLLSSSSPSSSSPQSGSQSDSGEHISALLHLCCIG